MKYYLATFASTHAALAFEQVFGGDGRLIPVPTAVRAGCGMGLRFSAPDVSSALKRIEDLACKQQLTQAVEGVYVCDDGQYSCISA